MCWSLRLQLDTETICIFLHGSGILPSFLSNPYLFFLFRSSRKDLMITVIWAGILKPGGVRERVGCQGDSPAPTKQNECEDSREHYLHCEDAHVPRSCASSFCMAMKARGFWAATAYPSQAWWGLGQGEDQVSREESWKSKRRSKGCHNGPLLEKKCRRCN